MRKKLVLAYSGGLDTSVLVHTLTKDRGYDVVAVHVDVGEAADADKLTAKAKKAGAVEARFVHAREEYAKDFIRPALFANALYEGVYPLASALSRPLIAKHLVAIAREVGATAVAHGSTGKGNDQVRFDVSIRALEPSLEVIAPQREKNLSRDAAIALAREAGIEIPATLASPWSIDENLWGRAIEGGNLEDLKTLPPEEVFKWTRSPNDAPADFGIARIGFENGVPVSLNGQKLGWLDLIEKVGKIAGDHGVGRIDHVEDRLVGIKSREVYEAPAAVALIHAHRELERLVSERETVLLKDELDRKWARLAYDGLWFSGTREALDAFNARVQQDVSGTIALRFWRGTMAVASRESSASLYEEKLATYGAGDTFDHRSGEGFCRIHGLPTVVYRKRHPVAK